VGAETDAARAQVLASRAALLEEAQRLEASARAAVDIPGKIRRQPAKAAGLAAGSAFVLLGGPQRLFRRARRFVLGPQADLPKSMLPKEVDKTLRKLGTDGDHVRAILEREFAHYLEQRTKTIRRQDTGALATTVVGNVLRPLSDRLGKQLTERLFDPDAEGFDHALAKVKARYAAAAPAEGEADAARGTARPDAADDAADPGSRGASFRART
jgi:hypothetical protein